MKPLHEERFSVALASRAVASPYAIIDSEGCMVAQTRLFEGKAIAHALAAGPVLARALLSARARLVALGAAQGPEWEAMESALREAGVPTPAKG